MQEINVANQYLDMCSKGVKGIFNVLKILFEQQSIISDKDMESKILKYIKEFGDFIGSENSFDLSNPNQIFAVSNLTKYDSKLIKIYIDNEIKKTDGEFSMPVCIIPQFNMDTNKDPEKASYMMIFNQKDVPKFINMLKFFKDNGIMTDNIHLEDISIVNNPNNLFNAENVKCNEIEFPMSDQEIFLNVKNFLIAKGFEINIAPHDNSMSIIYNREDQKDIIDILFDKDNKNSMLLWGTNNEKKIAEYKEKYVALNDKALNDRESAKDKLLYSGRE